MPRTQTVQTSYHANRTVVHETNPHVSGSTNYQTSVKFYTDGTFYKEVEGNPVSLKTGKEFTSFLSHDKTYSLNCYTVRL